MKLDRRQFVASASMGAMSLGRWSSSASVPDTLGVRDDFEAAREGTYLNTPYIGPVPRQVADAGVAFVRSKAEHPISLGSMLEKTNEARGKFARLFGADAREISFLFATSEGENVVTRALDLGAGDNVVVDDLHYETSYVLYKTLEREKGIEVRVAQSVGGRADVENFEPHVDDRTRVVSVAWVSHQNGFKHDLRGLSELAHAHGAYLYADAVQALGMFDTSLHDEGVDFLTSGTYKWLHASYGVAPFYVREALHDRVRPDRLGALSIETSRPGYEFEIYEDGRRFEYATLAFGAVYQLDAALDYLARTGLGPIERHVLPLAATMRGGLVTQGYRVLTPEKNGSSIVAFAHGKDPEVAQALFERENVTVSFREGGHQIRAGVALFNTSEDVERFLSVTERLSAS